MSTHVKPRIIDRKYAAVLHGDRVEIINVQTGEELPEDEPLMLFRGKDRLVRPLIEHYGVLCRTNGSPEGQVAGVDSELQRHVDFATKNPERMKTPD